MTSRLEDTDSSHESKPAELEVRLTYEMKVQVQEAAEQAVMS